MIHLPSSETIAARAKAAAYLAIKRNEALGVPSVVYDAAAEEIKELPFIDIGLPSFQVTRTEKDLYESDSPMIVVFAGPNGSGKSTIGDLLRPSPRLISTPTKSRKP